MLGSLLPQGLSEPEFCCGLVYKLKRFLALIIFQHSSYKNFPIIKRLAITLMIATDYMLGGQPNHGCQLCFPL